jgi:glutaredoxin-like protein
MLKEEDKKELQNQLNQMKDPVRLSLFTQKVAGSCTYCIETENLLNEVSKLSDLLLLDVYNFVTDKEQVKVFKIDKIPAIAIHTDQDMGIRFYGIPAGYEFASFLQSIILLSQGKSELTPDILKRLEAVNTPVHIQVFVTPTCPYCTRAALSAYQFAMKNEQIRADVVEVTEFPHLAQKYGVMGVPKIVINESFSFDGALPETMFLDHVEAAIKGEQTG